MIRCHVRVNARRHQTLASILSPPKSVNVSPPHSHHHSRKPPPSLSSSLYLSLTYPQEDLATFDQAHFSSYHHAHLSTHFLPPPAPGTILDDDDGLGYYPDGCKRTLTDAQIAIFRHSEIQELLRNHSLSPVPPGLTNTARPPPPQC